MRGTGIAYYRVRRGRGYWEPGPLARLFGFTTISCGVDGPYARSLARQWNAEWSAAREARPRSSRNGNPKNGSCVEGYVYFLRCPEAVKIGFSRNPWARLQTLRGGFPGEIVAFVAVKGTSQDEARLHALFAALRGNGEWFQPAPEISALMSRASVFGRISMPDEWSRGAARKASD